MNTDIIHACRRNVIFRLPAILACAAALGGGLDAREPALPRFQGDALPAGPQQSAPWTPPKTRLSSRLIAATRTLFAQGVADPRGCEYREIKTMAGDADREAEEGVAASHGWVLPADSARKGRFAVRWDGLVHPVLVIGPAADLRADAAEAAQEDQKGLLGLCLLLRLGEARLAEQYFDRLVAGMDRDELCDPYLLLAREWTASLFFRAASAHMRGDDRLALLTARTLVSAWEAVEAEATDLDLPHERPEPSANPHSAEVPLYLKELAPIRLILADQERRAAERRQKQDAPLHLADLPEIDDSKDFWKQVEGKLGRSLNTAQRIALMIRWFEETSADGNRLGRLFRPYRDEAVEPLLECLQHDRRLSRGGRFQIPQSGFEPETVDQVAYNVLCEILETGFEVWDSNTLIQESRKALAERIRAHWRKVRNLSPADGWFEILRDDSQSERWAEAVANTIALPSNPFGGHVEESAARRKAMRAKRNPSMTELLVKRAGNLAERGCMEQASEIALALADWSPGEALPVLRRQTARWREVLREQDPDKTHRIRYVPSGLVRVTLARAMLKDDTALPEYMQLLHEVSLPAGSYYRMDIFEPLLRYPDNPTVVAGAEWMFNDPASPWHAILRGDGALRCQDPRSLLGRNPLLALPSFRKLVLQTLADTRVVGVAKIDSYQQISISGQGRTAQTYAGDPLCPPPGSSVEVRRCDLCALDLAEIEGMPRCEFYWPKTRRDQAVAECIRVIRQYGRLLTGPAERTGGTVPARFAFPALDHPATVEDVRNGRAIFSLEGQGTTRSLKLPDRPAAARWVTLREEPYLAYHYDAAKKTDVPVVDYHQEGLVWQAEEVQVAGKWRRYYGFAGAGRLAKVAAAEIEFTGAAMRQKNGSTEK
jgi:hypothetical protein